MERKKFARWLMGGLAVCLAVVLTSTALAQNRAGVAAQAAAQVPTPRADGAITHIVQSDDTLWVIAIRYAPLLNMTPEQALPHIQEINNNPAFISPGQELFIVLPNEATPEPTAVPAEAEATPTAPADQPTPEAEATAVPDPQQPATNTGTVCVSAYIDSNANGTQDSGEPLVADAAITLARAENTVGTYVSDGVREPYCFEGLPADNYQVKVFPPANFTITTADSWGVALTEGIVVPVAFGVQPQASAEVATSAPAGEATAVPAAPAEETGLLSNFVPIFIGAAVLLVVVAAVGVILLRRG